MKGLLYIPEHCSGWACHPQETRVCVCVRGGGYSVICQRLPCAVLFSGLCVCVLQCVTCTRLYMNVVHMCYSVIWV